MRLAVAFVVLSGLAICAITFVFWGGGESMSMRHNDTKAGIGLSPSDTPLPGTFEKATFALG